MKRKKRVKVRGVIARLRASADVECERSTGGEVASDYGAERRKLKLWRQIPKKRVTVNLDADVLAWCREMGRGFQWRINRTLRRVMEREQRALRSSDKGPYASQMKASTGRPANKGQAPRKSSYPVRVNASAEAQPLIAVRDVRASSRWYGRLLAADSLPDHAHRDVYDRVFSAGRLILQLHAWDEEDHPNLVNADAAPHGHGVLLWFAVSDFDAAVDRARKLGAEVVLEPYFNPAPRHREMWLRDPDGYVVVIAGPDDEGGV